MTLLKNTILSKDQYPTLGTFPKNDIYLISCVTRSFSYENRKEENNDNYYIMNVSGNTKKFALDASSSDRHFICLDYKVLPRRKSIKLKYFLDPYAADFWVYESLQHFTTRPSFVRQKFYGLKFTNIFAWASACCAHPSLHFGFYNVEYLKSIPKDWFSKPRKSNGSIYPRCIYNIKPKQLANDFIWSYSPQQLIDFMKWELPLDWKTILI